jgi:ABC-type uncharacterized transport system ATPase subunit
MMYMTYKFHGFYDVAKHDELMVLEHDHESIRPFPHHVTVRSRAGASLPAVRADGLSRC